MKIEIKNISKVYKRKEPIIKDFNLKFPNNGIYLIKGDNGSGKTTLLNIIGLFDKPTSGSIFYDEKDVTNIKEKEKAKIFKEKVFYYNEDYNLFDFLKVKNNVLDFSNNYQEIFSSLGIQDLDSKDVKELSKGEKARVGLACALLSSRDVLLLDEPFAYLDEDIAKKAFELLKNYSKTHLIIFISHEVYDFDSSVDGLIEIKSSNIEIKDPVIQKENKITSKKIEKKKESSNFFKLALSYLKKRKVRFTFSILISIITFSVIVPCFNSIFNSTHKFYKDSLSTNDVYLGTIDLNNKDEDLKYMNLSKGDTFIESQVNLECTGQDKKIYSDDYKVLCPLQQKFSINGKDYDFGDFKEKYNTNGLILTSAVFKNFQNGTNGTIDKKISMKGILRNLPFNSGTFKFFDVIEDDINEIAIIDPNAILNQKIDYFSSRQIFSAVGVYFNDYINSNLRGGMCLSEGTLKNIDGIKSDYGGTLKKENEINIVFTDSGFKKAISKIGESRFNDLFLSDLKDTYVPFSDLISSKEFYFENIIEDYVIKGYKIIPDGAIKPKTSAFNYDFGFEVRDSLYKKAFEQPFFNSPLSSYRSNYSVNSNLLVNSKLFKVSSNTNFFEKKHEISDLKSLLTDVVNFKQVMDGFGLGFFIFFFTLLIIFDILFIISILDSNRMNMYVAKKNGNSLLSIGFSAIGTTLLSLIIGLVFGTIIGNYITIPLNATLNHYGLYTKTNPINYLPQSPYTYLILIAAMVVISLISYLLIYKKIDNKLAVEYLRTKKKRK